MKTRPPMRRSSLFALFAALTVTACSSSDDQPTPPLASGGSHASGGTGGASGGDGGTQTGGTSGTGGQATGGGGVAGGSAGSAGQGGASGTGGQATGGGGATGGSAGHPTGGSAGGGSGGNAGSGGVGGTAGGAGSGGAGSGGAGSGGAGARNWVGTWTASPYVDGANPPPVSLANAVLRQIVHVSLGGAQIRVQFSNMAGNGPVKISTAHVALCKATTNVDSTIDTTTDKALAFAGSASVTIEKGKEVWSDPIDFAVPNQGNVTITTAFASVPSSVCGHSGSRTTSYIKAASADVSAASMATATTTDHWFYISGIDVMAEATAKGIVAIGDSITDGRGTTTNGNNRWTDVLAARLQKNAATANVSMMNQAIGATNLVGSGTAAQARFNRDALSQSGVKYVIVFDGVNDIGGGANFADMKAAYQDLITRAHGAKLLIYGATILPFAGNSYYTTAHESVRQQVNTYIRSGAFDGVIDFDAAVTDGGNPPKLQAAYAKWDQEDWLHPGPGGYQKMGDTPDLTLFTK